MFVYTIQPVVKPTVKPVRPTSGCIVYTNIQPVVKPVCCKRLRGAKAHVAINNLPRVTILLLLSLGRITVIHRYVDAAYCYRRSSAVCRSVSHDFEPYRNG